MNCKLCNGEVKLRADVDHVRRTDASWSLVAGGWVCFGCMSEAPADDDEKTDPNIDLEWLSL